MNVWRATAATAGTLCSPTHTENTCCGSSRTFFPLLRRTRRLRRSPLHTVCPVGRGHLANCDVAGVTRLKRTALALRLVRLHPLLSETNRLDLVTLLGHHHMAFGRMYQLRSEDCHFLSEHERGSINRRAYDHKHVRRRDGVR